MKFCPNCAHPLDQRIPDGDNRPRYTCAGCMAIHYQNPRIVVGTVCTWGERILLCKRAIEPRYGRWTLPAGFMELGETMAEGATRETTEEAGAAIELDGLYSAIDVINAEQVHVFYRARMISDALDPGIESLEAKLFDEADIPWDELAFRTVTQTLRWFVADRARGSFELHTGEFRLPPKTAA